MPGGRICANALTAASTLDKKHSLSSNIRTFQRYFCSIFAHHFILKGCHVIFLPPILFLHQICYYKESCSIVAMSTMYA